jgi:hypothetical protein
VFIWGALNKKKRGAPKEYLPKQREPVVNPLLAEERVKRKETWVLNREASRQRNLAIIKAIMGEVMEKLATHRHIKHFRTDLHKYIDLGFNHVKDVPEKMNAARLAGNCTRRRSICSSAARLGGARSRQRASQLCLKGQQSAA